MKRRDPQHLEHLFLVSLSLAAAACGATSTQPPTGATGTSTIGARPTSAPHPVASSSAPHPLPPDDSTPAGYARAYHSAGHFEAALSGLELAGFANVVDDALVCDEGRPCPAAWEKLKDGTFQRAAVVRKRSALAVITTANFFEWVGPVDGPERAALRARIEPNRETATCSKLAELGYACGPGSEPSGIPVRAVQNGWEVATFDERNVCEGGGWGMARSLGAVIVDREGRLTDASTVLTAATDAKVRETVNCQYAVEGRRYEGYEDEPCDDASVTGYLARAVREETAAAIAFDRLADDLSAHGAPLALVRDARLAALQERRHAKMLRAELARALGAEALPAASEAPPPARARALVDVLVENAKEGCASETFAAIVASHRGLHAPTARLRATFTAIARDEQAHAALSHRVHAWGRSALVGHERRALDAAFDDAVRAFVERGETRPGAAFGEPPAAVARAAMARVVAALSVAA